MSDIFIKWLEQTRRVLFGEKYQRTDLGDIEFMNITEFSASVNSC